MRTYRVLVSAPNHADMELSAAPLLALSRPRVSRAVLWAAMAVWFCVMVVVCSVMLAKHLLPLPVPDAAARLGPGLSALRTTPGWAVFHVLAPACRCSGRVLAHLETSVRPAGVEEFVLLVVSRPEEEHAADALRGRMNVRVVHPQELAAVHGVEAVPLLVVMRPDASVAYAGGFTSRKQALDVEDLRIISSAMRWNAVESLPLFGCAVSQRLRQILNPWMP